MKAVVLTEKGGPEVLRVHEVPDPVPGPDEVLVDVVSTAINRADVLQRMGFYPQPAPVPAHEIPGLEFAGRVAALGERVTRWRVGDAVMGIVSGGGYAERVTIHERQAIAVAGVDLRDAGAIPEVWITAFDALVVQGGLRPGSVALIHAGGSGVGTAGIQIAKAIGAMAIVTVSGSKVRRCLDLGADRAIDYTKHNYAEELKATPVDVILDVIGGDYLDKNLDVLAPKGTIVQVGTMGAGKAPINLGKLMTKRAHLVGTVLRARPLDEKIDISQRFAKECLPWFESGVFKPILDARFTLDQLPEAHRMMEANQNFGKIVIEVAQR